MTEAITSFRGAYAFLSNFAYSPITYEGQTYATVEHAFQASKTNDPAWRVRIRDVVTAAEAKRLGRQVPLRADWEAVKVDVMRALLRLKFARPELREKLLATGEATLIEGNTWGDRFWGAVWERGRWEGKNLLGQLLMEVRAEVASG